VGSDVIQGTVGTQRMTNQINPRDLFNTPGVSDHYLMLDEQFVGAPTVNQPVTFTQDGVVTVGGVVQNFPPDVWGAFEVNDAGVSVLPARMAFAVLFGGVDPYDQQLFQWQAPTSTFNIDPTGHAIWFQVGNQTMGLRGATQTIMSGEGAQAFPTAPYVNPTTERMMLPVRAFAEALGFDVQWNAADGSVTLIPAGYTGN